MKLEVVKIVNEKKDGFVEINESDFDKEKHVLYKEEVKKEGSSSSVIVKKINTKLKDLLAAGNTGVAFVVSKA